MCARSNEIMCPRDKYAPTTPAGMAVIHAAEASVVASCAGPTIDIGGALMLAQALGADREAAADLLIAVIGGFNRAMSKRSDNG